jgi:hypothetical protein
MVLDFEDAGGNIPRRVAAAKTSRQRAEVQPR